ncbi:MAG TPA: type II toxin-antitoxin system RelE/ParE family toxin [Pseudolabrys sp.]|nr:type II toxin-antitoxin system RelE/ParE family toxin [Pseudolabrys sp.]
MRSVKIRFTADALSHLNSIYEFLAARNEAAARRIMFDIRAAAERLCDFHRMGRQGDTKGTHEWVVRGSPYIIVYEFDELNSEIRVLAVFTAHRIAPNNSSLAFL